MLLHRYRSDRWQSLRQAASRPIRGARQLRERRAATMIDTALAGGRVCLVHQPAFHARDTGRIGFCEGLARVRGPAGTLLPPARFLSANTCPGTTLRLDCAVMDMTLRDLAARPDLRLSVNAAPTSVTAPEWLASLEAAAERNAEILFRLIVEITEEADLFGDPRMRDTLERLRSFGVTLALDDFGGGMTNIRQFRAARFDILKIDGSLCQAMAEDADARALIRALTALAHHYGMTTVAEHVDRTEVVAVAQELGIDLLQGNHFGVPYPALPPKAIPAALSCPSRVSTAGPAFA